MRDPTMQLKRPTDKELCKRITEAKECLNKKKGLFANPAKTVAELNQLDIGHANEVWELIKTLLSEISSKDYKGAKPPQKSYEKATIGHELLAFSWWSSKMAKQMYMKFVLKNERFYYVSLHECRSTEQKGDI